MNGLGMGFGRCAGGGRPGVALTFFRSLKTFRLTFLRVRNKIKVKSSMSSQTTKHFRYKCHGLFVNSPVMITVKSFLKCCLMQQNITFFFINNCHGLWRTTVT